MKTRNPDSSWPQGQQRTDHDFDDFDDGLDVASTTSEENVESSSDRGTETSEGEPKRGRRRRRRSRRGRGNGSGQSEVRSEQSDVDVKVDDEIEEEVESTDAAPRDEEPQGRRSRRGRRGGRRDSRDRGPRDSDTQEKESRRKPQRDSAPAASDSSEESDSDGDRKRSSGSRNERTRSSSRGERSRPAKQEKKVRKEMLVNAAQPEECRIAIIEDGVLEELYTERASQDNYVGNIYKGKVVNLEPSIQAAFVDFGVGKNGFLHISDVESQYFRQGGFDPKENFGPDGRVISAEEAKRREQGRRQRFSSRPRYKPPIQEIFKRGDEVVVQVIKEGIGTKGPTLSTYISIPGRYLVLMPALGRVGVSRKIEDEDDRRRLRDILLDLNPPKGLGFIVRTAGQGRLRRDLSRDLSYLLRLWKVISRRIEKKPAPVDIYEESDMMIRTIRDILTADVDKIQIDNPDAFGRAKEFLELIMPKSVDKLEHYEGTEPLFHKYGVEQEIANIHRREVKLKDGGSIVVDQTEALVAIDVNSGSFRTDDSAEETAYQLNLKAAREIARQLRLRDLGGVIVNDFIDMRKERHRRNLERALRDAVARDRARTKILRTSPFGLIEMTRQRIRPSLKRSVFSDCPCCSGRGMVKTAESMAIEVIRTLALACRKKEVAHVTIKVNDEVAALLNNTKRRELSDMEVQGNMIVQILGDQGVFPEALDMKCKDADGREVHVPV